MRKFTLFTMALLMSVVMYAQKRMPVHSAIKNTVQKTFVQKSPERNAGATQMLRRAGDVVTVPEGLETADYAIKARNYNDDADVNVALKIGFAGSDVYVQGICSFFPEAWMKGTLDGTTVTFAKGQYFGTYGGTYEMYLNKLMDADVVFTYDAEAGTFTAQNEFFLTDDGSNYYFDSYRGAVITKVVEKAATPANPSITSLENSNYGYIVNFNVPLEDTEGNAILASKLSYVIYTETNGEVAALTFTSATHSKLTEDMTEIPYGFTDNYDFYASHIYLNDLYSADWTKIGIKSIYKGGGETNETEIQWFTIETEGGEGGEGGGTNTLVTLPETATPATWYTTGGNFYANGSSGMQDVTSKMSIAVAFDGSDVYIQGLAYWFKTAWIKGTLDGTTVTFPSGQLVGTDDYGNEYIIGSSDGSTIADIVFTYDSEAGTLTAATPYIIESGSATEISAYCYWSSPVFSSTEPEKPDTVVAPESVIANAEDYVLNAADNKGSTVSHAVKVGFDGTDVYIQGFASYLPEAWMKGTLNEATKKVTFAANQFFGTYSDSYDMYLNYNSYDVVMSYDSEKGTFTADSAVVRVNNGQYYFDYYAGLVITKVVEKAGVPATPVVKGVAETKYGDVMSFSIPLQDVDGNALASSKLSYIVFKDINHEVDTVTFTTADFTKLTEDMTVIPYGFTEDYDFYADQIYLNMEHSDWNRVGIQSIYTGGGEENRSEIGWFTIKEYTDVTIDFNAMTEVATSSNKSTAGDILSDTTFVAGGFKLTVSPKTSGDIENRMWATSKGPQLRVYSGTLTFEAPADKVFTSIEFNTSKWNAENTADTGVIENKVWSDSTATVQKVVFTIAGNTQINSITINFADFVPQPVAVPEDLTTDIYNFTATALVNGEEATKDYASQVNVGFYNEGAEMYIKGLVGDKPEFWAKATKNEEGNYVIPANQFLGTYDVGGYGLFIYNYYITALTTDSVATDIVLTYDAEAGTIKTDQPVVLTDLTEPYVTYTNFLLTKFVETAATPAQPSIIDFVPGGSYPKVKCNIPATDELGNALNQEKMSYIIWIEKDGQQQELTLTTDLYTKITENMTEIPYNFTDDWDIYAGGTTVYLNQSAEEIASWTKIGVQSIYRGGGEEHKSTIGWLETGAQGISTVHAAAAAKTAKFFENGRMVIIKNGQKFNAAGQLQK